MRIVTRSPRRTLALLLACGLLAGAGPAAAHAGPSLIPVEDKAKKDDKVKPDDTFTGDGRKNR